MSSYQISSISTFEMTPYVKKLIAVNVGVWFFGIVVLQQYFLKSSGIFSLFGLNPQLILSDYYAWQLLTYMFVHSNGVFHILFNMFILWMFGSELEKLWGSKFFLLYYLCCGLGAGFIYLLCLVAYVFGFNGDAAILSTPVIGASGAVFGLLYAYGIIYKERTIYLMMVIPIKAKNFVLLIAAMELVSLLNSGLGSPVANLAHLGGIASGSIFLILWKYFQKVNIKRWKREKGDVHLKIVKNDDNRSEVDFH